MTQRSQINLSTDELHNLSFDAFDEAINPRSKWHDFDAIVEEVLAPWILYQKKYFPHVKSIGGSDAFASLPIINMKIFEEWVLPYILRLREICGPEVYVPN